MATTYQKASPENHKFLADVMQRYRPDLVEKGVQVSWVWAYSNKGPAVKLHGHPCYATIKKNSAKQIAEGLAHATILVDQTAWEGLSDASRVAMLHHELHHLEVSEDKDGEVVIGMRLHDYQLAGFFAIVDEHKQDAVEFLEARALAQTRRQLVFSWLDEGETTTKGKENGKSK